MTSTHHDLAVELLRLLSHAPGNCMSIMDAKDAFCGRTRPIRDLHAAMGYAHANGWLDYSDNYLSLRLKSLGRAVAELAIAS